MKHDDEISMHSNLTDAYTELSKLFFITPQSGFRKPQSPPRPNEPGERGGDNETSYLINQIDALMRSAAERYQKIDQEARSITSSPGVLPRLMHTMSLRNGGQLTELTAKTEATLAAMARLFSRASAPTLPAVVPLAGRMESGEIAIYEPYERAFHAASARTTIGTISGDWVRRRSDGILGTPDILLDLEYAHDTLSPEVVVELTWVGVETVTVSGGPTWNSTPIVSADSTTGLRIRTVAMSPIAGWVKLPMTISQTSTVFSRYDVWIRTTATEDSGPVVDDDDRPVTIPPTPLPVPVPSPTPTGIPTDIFAALDPDRWRQIEDRLGQFVRDTVGAFEGVLSRVDILRDRAVLRDVSAALRDRDRG